MEDTPEQIELPPGLRWLKTLVTMLMVTLILGVITIVGLLVTRLPGAAPKLVLPEALALPEGAVPQAITQGAGWIGVVTTDSRMFIFTPTGRLVQEITVTLPQE
jgi:Flp pilus assembly protein protease CpaA